MSPERRIKAEEILADIRSGMTDSQLMEKYNLSHRQLQKVRSEVEPPGQIRIKEIVQDIRARTSDFELMQKYNLSTDALDGVLRELVAIGAVREAELKERSSFYDEPANRRATRRVSRTRVATALPIHDANDADWMGLLRDLSDHGVRVASRRPGLREIRSFVIKPEATELGESIRFDVICKWIRVAGARRRHHVAGFEITNISEEDLQRLRQLIRQIAPG
jgi:uncharacterized protein (DUF433 family)